MSRDDLRRVLATYPISATQVIYSAQLKAQYREIQELREQVREAEIAALQRGMHGEESADLYSKH